MREKRLSNTRRGKRRQRGTAYVLVLAITTLLVTLGLAANQLAQNEIEQGDAQLDIARARVAAQYTQDYIHKGINGSTTWRDGITNTNWRYFAELDGVKIWYSYADPIDGDLTDDYGEPFRLYTLAVAGDARRIYSAEYTVDNEGNLTRDASSFRQDVFYK